MQSRHKTGCAHAHPEATSSLRTYSESDSAWYQRWLALDDHRLLLLDRLCELQRHLEKQVGWFALSDEARAEIEKSSGLSDLETSLRLVQRRLRRWLPGAPTHSADDMAVISASLEVATRLLPAEENPVVHGMITRAVRDLKHLRSPAEPMDNYPPRQAHYPYGPAQPHPQHPASIE